MHYLPTYLPACHSETSFRDANLHHSLLSAIDKSTTGLSRQYKRRLSLKIAVRCENSLRSHHRSSLPSMSYPSFTQDYPIMIQTPHTLSPCQMIDSLQFSLTSPGLLWSSEKFDQIIDGQPVHKALTWVHTHRSSNANVETFAHASLIHEYRSIFKTQPRQQVYC